MIIYRMLKKYIDKIPYYITWLLTFVFINISWIYFRDESVSCANTLITRLFSGGFTLNYEITEALLNIVPISIVSILMNFEGVLNILMIAIMAVTIFVCLFTRNVQERVNSFKAGMINLITTGALMTWSILSLSGVSTFL